MKIGICGLGLLVVLSSSIVAHAQEDEATSVDGTAESSPAPSEDSMAQSPSADEAVPAEGAASDSGAEATPSEAGDDGGRFRFGVAAGAGPLSAEGLSMMYYGVDLRFGWQINNAFGVYAQPQIGYYKLNGASALFGSGGLIGGSVVADYTLLNRLFLGVGAGYAVLNNPSGAELHFRAGGYPLMWRNEETGRRKGIMLGVDFRVHFVDSYTFIAPTFNLGYDSF